MPNMSLTKIPMPAQEPNVRNKNFDEVALGYTEEMAMEEATRCINCKNKPCMSGCPVCVRIQAQMVFRLSADVFVHRKISVKENVSEVSRVSLLLLVVSKDLSPTTIWHTAMTML